MSKPDFAHVGYHRTATNFLQKNVFPSLSESIFMPHSAGWRFYCEGSGLGVEDARAFYAREQEGNAGDKPFLISFEGLTGTHERDDFAPAEKLKQLNPDMGIILVIRSQYEILPSLYHLHIKDRGSLDYRGFVERAISGGKCRYLAMVRRLQALFGAEAVKIMLFEDLKRSPEDFLEELCGFLRVPGVALAQPAQQVNAREPDAALRLRRVVNSSLGEASRETAFGRLLYDGAGRVAGKLDRWSQDLTGAPLAPIERESAEAPIREAYAEENRQLAELIDKPICDYGYPH